MQRVAPGRWVAEPVLDRGDSAGRAGVGCDEGEGEGRGGEGRRGAGSAQNTAPMRGLAMVEETRVAGGKKSTTTRTGRDEMKWRAATGRLVVAVGANWRAAGKQQAKGMNVVGILGTSSFCAGGGAGGIAAWPGMAMAWHWHGRAAPKQRHPLQHGQPGSLIRAIHPPIHPLPPARQLPARRPAIRPASPPQRASTKQVGSLSRTGTGFDGHGHCDRLPDQKLLQKKRAGGTSKGPSRYPAGLSAWEPLVPSLPSWSVATAGHWYPASERSSICLHVHPSAGGPPDYPSIPPLALSGWPLRLRAACHLQPPKVIPAVVVAARAPGPLRAAPLGGALFPPGQLGAVPAGGGRHCAVGQQVAQRRPPDCCRALKSMNACRCPRRPRRSPCTVPRFLFTSHLIREPVAAVATQASRPPPPATGSTPRAIATQIPDAANMGKREIPMLPNQGLADEAPHPPTWKGPLAGMKAPSLASPKSPERACPHWAAASASHHHHHQPVYHFDSRRTARRQLEEGGPAPASRRRLSGMICFWSLREYCAPTKPCQIATRLASPRPVPTPPPGRLSISHLSSQMASKVQDRA
ncbi:hypothetical protein Purlil1_3631 [Purpureocillium lilacinum]|uniref:Uncharacterized protein n=1 Tax=Purpureocillium lilacinum TaxID=33203 RepID=A0ABR0C617_PURLI|nr:hypothetical protein Purlil1_3631 [Purpureocillium lilacinum]